MADEDKLAKAGLEALMKPFADMLEKIAGPAAEEFGLTLKDHVRVFRFERQLRLFERVKEMVAESNMEPGRVPIKLLLPMVENASIEENNELQDRWAAMLANAAVNRDTHPSFPEILKQLNEKEVAYLDACYEYLDGRRLVDEDRITPAIERKRRYGELDIQFFLQLGSCLDFTTEDPQKTLETLGTRVRQSGLQNNVIRLGLMRAPVEDLNHKLTDFGKAFVKACRPPVPIQYED
jgi:abortive infection alpha-like protein